MEFVGSIKQVLPERRGTSQRTNNEWVALPFIFEYFENENDRYADTVLLETFDTNIQPYIKEGLEVRIGFGHRTREYEGKVYNELRMYKIESIKKQKYPQDMLDIFVVAEGSLNSVSMTARAVTQRAYARNAAFCVLAHNHPGGLPVPSGEDIEVSQMMERAFSLMDIPLLEHFVVAENKCASIMKNQRGHFRISPLTGESDPAFYRTFYGE